MTDMLKNTQRQQGGKFFTYSAYDNNCQDFIIALLASNGILTPQYQLFVKQSTKELFSDPNFRKFANSLTDIAAVGSRAAPILTTGILGSTGVLPIGRMLFGGSLYNMRVQELRDVIKKNKRHYNRPVKVTGLKKAELLKLAMELSGKI